MTDKIGALVLVGSGAERDVKKGLDLCIFVFPQWQLDIPVEISVQSYCVAGKSLPKLDWS